MANDLWMQLFLSAEAGFLSEGLFDHFPMVLSVYPCNNTARKPFRYFDMWKHADGYTELVKSNWHKPDVGTSMYQVVMKIRRMKGVFKQLNKDGFYDIQAANLKALHELAQCQRELHMNPNDSDIVDKETAAANQYRIVHSVYLSFLRQKSKEAWAKGGDENSAIFHKSIRARVLQNSVYAIHDMEGNWVCDEQSVANAFLQYYQKLLGSNTAHRSCIMPEIVAAGPILNTVQGQCLTTQVTGDEVKAAMFAINGDKAPGLMVLGATSLRRIGTLWVGIDKLYNHYLDPKDQVSY
ncbi:uncharacterized protein [Spinacia oleracea]|uniref:Uncharacterized protein n=1 Tax=Spinacia oleracea TaxID=3562 RepID=A0A9R0J6P4_SPIOL|nr:uncharacterized protein LOC110801217 [Spinacia oleracea]